MQLHVERLQFTFQAQRIKVPWGTLRYTVTPPLIYLSTYVNICIIASNTRPVALERVCGVALLVDGMGGVELDRIAITYLDIGGLWLIRRKG